MAKPKTLKRVTSLLAKSNPALWENTKYLLYRDLLRNPASRRKLESQNPSLDDAQQDIIKNLFERGIAFSSFDALLADDERWGQLSEAAAMFAASEEVRAGINDYQMNFQEAGPGKEFVVKKYPKHSHIELASVWMQFGLDSKILDVVNSYLELWSKLMHIDLWYNIPVRSDRPTVASQCWHRDPEDEKLVKVFLYFSDVDEGAGALQYIPGSPAGGRYQHLWPRANMVDAVYPPEHEIEKKVPRSEWVSGAGKAGTLVFCDTGGLHRGGYCTQRERILATWMYVTPASLFSRRFHVDWTEDESRLSPVARFALT
jgi:Phytanoyl-CoA dioxygenase (PhyH)